MSDNNMDNFQQLLAGAHAMDTHFQTAELEHNMPVMLALLTLWYTGFFEVRSTALVPYAQLLRQFPKFLQQLSMESLGKSVTAKGDPVDTRTGEVIWGAEGSNSQHSFFQLLHQGTELIPVDYIAVARGADNTDPDLQRKLLANCLSQSLALMQGRHNDAEPHRHYPGNRPSNTLLLAELNPWNLGALIALYEHKVYTQSVLMGINAFDQWGVELGKELATSLQPIVEGSASAEGKDGSTAALVGYILKHRA